MITFPTLQGHYPLIEEVINGAATGAVSAITIAELWADKQVTSENRLRQQAVLHLMETIVIDNTVARQGGIIRQVHDLKLPDALVVASCQITKRRFFSKDPHFRRLLDTNEVVGEIL